MSNPANRSLLTRPITRIIPLNEYINSIAKFNLNAIFGIVFDQLVAFTTHYITKDEIESWFRDAGLSDVAISFRNGNSWRGTGLKDA